MTISGLTSYVTVVNGLSTVGQLPLVQGRSVGLMPLCSVFGPVRCSSVFGVRQCSSVLFGRVYRQSVLDVFQVFYNFYKSQAVSASKRLFYVNTARGQGPLLHLSCRSWCSGIKIRAESKGF